MRMRTTSSQFSLVKVMHLQPCHCIIWLQLPSELFVRWAMYFTSSSRNHFLRRSLRCGIPLSLMLDTVMLHGVRSGVVLAPKIHIWGYILML